MAAPPASVDTLVSDLRTIFGSRLESLVMYGVHVTDSDPPEEAPINCLALVQSLAFDDLRALAAQRSRWERRRLATPLLLTHDEFARSLDVFPFEYGDIIDHHRLILGDPFKDLQVAPDDRRRACEVQAKSHLLHLREGFIECGGRPDEVAQLIARSAAPLAALLRNVTRLGGVPPPSGALARVLAMHTSGAPPAKDAIALYPEYLSGVEQIARALDRSGHPGEGSR